MCTSFPWMSQASSIGVNLAYRVLGHGYVKSEVRSQMHLDPCHSSIFITILLGICFEDVNYQLSFTALWFDLSFLKQWLWIKSIPAAFYSKYFLITLVRCSEVMLIFPIFLIVLHILFSVCSEELYWIWLPFVSQMSFQYFSECSFVRSLTSCCCYLSSNLCNSFKFWWKILLP